MQLTNDKKLEVDPVNMQTPNTEQSSIEDAKNLQSVQYESKHTRFKKYMSKINKLFFIFVVLPTLVSTIYFGFIASDVYISESHFIVRSHNTQSTLTGLGALLRTTGLARAQDDTYTVNTYIRSRDVIPKLNQAFNLAEYYGSNKVDLFSRFDPLGLDNSTEALHQYLQKKVIVDMDMVSAISTLKVKAYTAEAAYEINENLLNMSEALINQLNDRARKDTIGFSNKLVLEAEIRVKESADNLYEFRLKHGIYDLNKQTEAQMQLISKLQDALIAVQTQLTQVKAVTANNPQIPALKARERALQKEIQLQMSKIFGTDNKTITSNVAEYERLILEHKLAEQQLTAAITSLENAKDEAQRKQLYLERIAQPNKADAPLEPHRLMNILATVVLGLLFYGVLTLFVVSVQEHQD